ncbi:hypothetical protein ACKWRH_06715 [Bradyrhizobium sp. Pa8]|uniref:hypothetical protein n=1 Tax=Bradyrhizobium sp. Pa8 TaxID=3386552 RepID=UPI00403F9203
MGLRDAFVNVLAMKERGAPLVEIYDYVRITSEEFGGGTWEGDENGFEVRLIATGAAISFNGTDYSYRV